MALEQKDLRKLLETAIVAARLAGARAMEEFGYVKASFKTSSTGDKEIVTEADARCQQIIVDRIKETYPDHGFIGEEGSHGKIFKQSPRGDNQIWWIIDPIDGTSNFAHHVPLFCVCIAAMHEGRPVVGVIFDPATDRIYTAFEGGDAQLNDRKITVSDELVGQNSSVGLDSQFNESLPDWAKQLILRTRYRNLGSAGLQLAYIASGGLIATINTTVKLWDIAAGAIIAEQAGAIVTDHSGKKLFPFDLDAYQGGILNMIASNPKIHAEIVKLIAS